MPFTRVPVFFIGLRYLLTRRENRFFSLTSLIAVAGLALGVTALILVLSVFNGSQGIQRDRTLLTVPHADLWSTSGVADWQAARAVVEAVPGVVAAAPCARGRPAEQPGQSHGDRGARHPARGRGRCVVARCCDGAGQSARTG